MSISFATLWKNVGSSFSSDQPISLLVFLTACLTVSFLQTRYNQNNNTHRRIAKKEEEDDASAATSSSSSSSSSSIQRATPLTTPRWPHVPGAWPLIGNSLGPKGISNFTAKVREWASQYGQESPILQCTIYGKSYYIVCHNALALKVMQLRPYTMHKTRNLKAAAKSLGADGIFAAEGKVWQHDRRLLAPFFNQKAIVHDYLPILQASAERLVQKWKRDLRFLRTSTIADHSHHHRTLIINRDLACWTVDNIGQIAFGGVQWNSLERTDSQDAKDIQTIFQRLLHRSICPLPYWRLPWIGKYLDGTAYHAQRRIHHQLSSLIQQEQLRQASPQQSSSSSSMLSKMVKDAPSIMPHHRIHGNLQTMLIAGADTTSSALMICLYYIAKDAILQEELYQEIIQEVSTRSKSSSASSSNLDRLFRCKSLIYEVIRFQGPAPQLMCQSKVDLEVEGWGTVPAGSRLILPTEYLGTLDDSGIPLGPHATPRNTFGPRRWLQLASSSSDNHANDNDNGNGNKSTHISGVIRPSIQSGVALSTGFGGGVRICPGQHLAETELLVGLTHILKHFEIGLSPDQTPVRMVSQLSVVPDRDIALVFQERQRGHDEANDMEEVSSS